PQSSTTISTSYSRTMQFIPISPRPPSGTMRSPFRGVVTDLARELTSSESRESPESRDSREPRPPLDDFFLRDISSEGIAFGTEMHYLVLAWYLSLVRSHLLHPRP